MQPPVREALTRIEMNRKFGNFEGYIRNLPTVSSQVVGLFDQFLLDYPECPNKGVFKSNGIFPVTTSDILGNIALRVNWEVDKAIIFFKRSRKSKLAKFLEKELTQELNKYIESQEPDVESFELIGILNRSLYDSLNDYIDVKFQSELDAFLEPSTEIIFERDVLRALAHYFKIKLVDALKEDALLDRKRLDRCLFRCLQSESWENFRRDSDSLVCLTKWGIFWVDGTQNCVQFSEYGFVEKCELAKGYRPNDALRLRFFNGSECLIQTESRKFAKVLSEFIEGIESPVEEPVILTPKNMLVRIKELEHLLLPLPYCTDKTTFLRDYTTHDENLEEWQPDPEFMKINGDQIWLERLESLKRIHDTQPELWSKMKYWD